MNAVTVGIIGAGQLGRMMALAGIPMGIEFEFLESTADAPAAGLGTTHIGSFEDADAIEALARRVDVLTFDVENVSAEALRRAQQHTRVAPGADALDATQDRLSEKTLFRSLGIGTAQFIAVNSKQQLREAVNELGFPCVLKTRRMGYDGRGQRFIKTAQDIDTSWEAFQGHALIVEQFVSFEREVSLVSVRALDGTIRFYALSENTHSNGILHLSLAPYDDSNLQTKAQNYARAVLEKLNYVGVMTIEFFVLEGKLLANEIAPRVHNSGHWTIEGAATSQFANHIRAICGLPIGNCNSIGHSAMVNFLGAMPSRENCLAIEQLYYHDYGKVARPSRKIGHATIVSESKGERKIRTDALLELYQADL